MYKCFKQLSWGSRQTHHFRFLSKIKWLLLQTGAWFQICTTFETPANMAPQLTLLVSESPRCRRRRAPCEMWQRQTQPQAMPHYARNPATSAPPLFLKHNRSGSGLSPGMSSLQMPLFLIRQSRSHLSCHSKKKLAIFLNARK